jgi:predicted NAD-dependent protein-ADP-ribosyltransferase YbiA (DUF1768 family)
MSIKLFDPNDKPYGHLSNNYSYPIKIDDLVWKNVTQYIYTNMTPILYRNTVKNSKNIHDSFKKYNKQSEVDVLSESLLTALNVKFKNHKILKVLLSTGDNDILYISDNDILGVGKDNNGLNKVGKYLVQIRNQYKNKEKIESGIEYKVKKLYNVFAASLALDYAIRDGNDLKEYFGLTIDEIIDKYSRDKLFKKIPKFEIFKKTFNTDDNSVKLLNLGLLYPDVLIYQTRKEELRIMAAYKLFKLKQKIFNTYINNFIKRKYPNLPLDKYEKLKKQKFENLSYDEKEKIINRIYNLKNIENNPIRNNINNFVNSVNIPTDEEINEAENFDIKYSTYDKPIVSKLFEKQNIIESPKYIERNFVSSEEYVPNVNPKYKIKDININIPVLDVVSTIPKSPTYNKKFMEEFDEKSYDSDASSNSSSGYSISSESESESESENVKEDDKIKIKEEITPLFLNKYEVYYHVYDDNNKEVDILLFDVENKIYKSITFKNKGDFRNFFSKLDKTKELTNILKELSEYEPTKLQTTETRGIVKIYSTLYDEENYKNVLNDNYTIQMLSPGMYTGLLSINDINYPSVSHYIIASLFTLIPEIKTFKNAENYTLKNPKEVSSYSPFNWMDLNDIFTYYQYELYKSYNNRIKIFAEKALDVKFNSYELQEILLSTNNKQLLWTGKDNILGFDKMNIYSIDNIERYDKTSNIDFVKRIKNNVYISNGQNFVGNYLMTLRTKFEKLKLEQKYKIISIDKFNEIENDPVIKNWLDLRSSDMCKTVLKTVKYIKNKYNVEMSIYQKKIKKINTFNYLFEIIINGIYNSCNSIPMNIKNNDISISFINMVRKNIRNNKDILVYEFLWKRLLSLLDFIINNTKEPTLIDVKNLLFKIESLLSQNNKCLKIIQNNNRVNCILSAIINILVRLKEMHKDIKSFSNILILDFIYSKLDVELAVSIILNTQDLIKLKEIYGAGIYTEEEKRFEEREEKEEQEFGYEKPIEFEEEGVEPMEEDLYKEPETEDEEDDEREIEVYPDEESENEYDYEGEYDEGDCDGSDNNLLTEKMISNYKYTITKFFIENKIGYIDNTTSEYILRAVNFIINYKMNNKIKNNRINFFATLT